MRIIVDCVDSPPERPRRRGRPRKTETVRPQKTRSSYQPPQTTDGVTNYGRVLKLVEVLQNPIIHFIDYRSSSKKLMCVTGTVQRAYETPEARKVDLKPFWLYKYEKTDYSSMFGRSNPETLISTFGEAISLTYPGLVIECKDRYECSDRIMSLESDFEAHKKEATEIILEITGKTTAQELNKYFLRAKNMSRF